jgi:hypothetical protein
MPNSATAKENDVGLLWINCNVDPMWLAREAHTTDTGTEQQTDYGTTFASVIVQEEYRRNMLNQRSHDTEAAGMSAMNEVVGDINEELLI